MLNSKELAKFYSENGDPEGVRPYLVYIVEILVKAFH